MVCDAEIEKMVLVPRPPNAIPLLNDDDCSELVTSSAGFLASKTNNDVCMIKDLFLDPARFRRLVARQIENLPLPARTRSSEQVLAEFKAGTLYNDPDYIWDVIRYYIELAAKPATPDWYLQYTQLALLAMDNPKTVRMFARGSNWIRLRILRQIATAGFDQLGFAAMETCNAYPLVLSFLKYVRWVVVGNWTAPGLIAYQIAHQWHCERQLCGRCPPYRVKALDLSNEELLQYPETFNCPPLYSTTYDPLSAPCPGIIICGRSKQVEDPTTMSARATLEEVLCNPTLHLRNMTLTAFAHWHKCIATTFGMNKQHKKTMRVPRSKKRSRKQHLKSSAPSPSQKGRRTLQLLPAEY